MEKQIDNLLGYVKKILNFIFKYRYIIAIIIFILCVLFEISGSSIGMWQLYIKTDTTNSGLIFGEPRGIRSDEWAVLTPMMFSQQFDGFNYFSNLVRGDTTDVAMIYALPIMEFIQIFRPFQIGFLILGVAKGLSFFWCGRFIALFLVMIELGMILTKKNKTLSVLMAFLITLAPIVQWWFAVNGIAEIFIFGGLAIIALYKYMNSQSFKKRLLYLFLMYVCAGGYFLVIYPSWQVPMVYVFLMIAIWVIVQNRKECKMKWYDWISIAIMIFAFIGSMAYILIKSSDTIIAVMNSLYPGARAETGGGAVNEYFQYIMNILLPFKEGGLIINQSEAAIMFTLFPMGIIIAGILFFKEKKKDLLLILLFVAYIFLSIWCIFGFPEIIAKITLLSNSQAKRAMLAVGTLDVLILVRSLSLIEKPIKRIPALIISALLTIFMVYKCERQNVEYITLIIGIAMGIMCIYLFYMIFRYKAKYAKYFLSVGIIFVMIMSGLTVNPVQKGVDFIYESNIIKKVQEINSEEQGKWIVEGLGFPAANYFLMAGVPIINSTNTYPDLDRWNKIDTEKKYQDVYNRYAHITINIVQNEEELSEGKFVLLNPDSFKIYLTAEELKILEIKYVFSINKLEQFNTENIKFNQIYNYEKYYIYKLEVL